MIEKNTTKIISIVKPYGNNVIKKFLSKENFILVYNSIGEFELKENEYKICEIFNEKFAYENVLEESLKLKLVKTESDFEIIYKTLKEKNIIVEFDMSPNSIFMNNIIIKRNGIGIGRTEDNKWVVECWDNTFSENGIIELSGKEEYRVWMCANGTTTAKDILSRIGSRMNNQEENEVTILLERNLFKFLKLGLWELEYCDNTNDIKSKEDEKFIFDIENLRESCLLLPIGFELGRLNTSKEEYWISRGQEWIVLNEKEYKLWKRLNKNVMKLGQLQFELCKNKEEIIDEYLKSMLEKRLIMLWDTEFLSKTKNIRVSSQGRAIISQNKELSCKFKSAINLGYEPEVFEFSHRLWMVVSGDKCIEDIVKIMYDKYKNDSTYEEIQERVVENIRALMSLGLIRIDIL